MDQKSSGYFRSNFSDKNILWKILVQMKCETGRLKILLQLYHEIILSEIMLHEVILKSIVDIDESYIRECLLLYICSQSEQKVRYPILNI